LITIAMSFEEEINQVRVKNRYKNIYNNNVDSKIALFSYITTVLLPSLLASSH
jgi:hypothetical protein